MHGYLVQLPPSKILIPFLWVESACWEGAGARGRGWAPVQRVLVFLGQAGQHAADGREGLGVHFQAQALRGGEDSQVKKESGCRPPHRLLRGAQGRGEAVQDASSLLCT